MFMEKIEVIIKMEEIVHDTDKEKYHELIDNKLRKMNSIIDELYSEIEKLNYSEEKYNIAKSKLYNEKNLTKKLFPYYWQCLNELKMN